MRFVPGKHASTASLVGANAVVTSMRRASLASGGGSDGTASMYSPPEELSSTGVQLTFTPSLEHWYRRPWQTAVHAPSPP